MFDTSRQTCEHLASLIVGQDAAPQWLVDHVQRWIPPISVAHCSDSLQLTRAALLKRMTVVAEATQTLAAAIADTPTREFLEMDPFGPLDEANLQRVLMDLNRRAQGVRARPHLVTAEGKPRAGRTKAMPLGAFLPKELCAALVVETWTYVRGRKPGSRNKAACNAAQTLWEAADTGPPTGWGETRIEGWRPHFKAAGEPRLASFCAEVRRHLTASKRRAAALGQ